MIQRRNWMIASLIMSYDHLTLTPLQNRRLCRISNHSLTHPTAPNMTRDYQFLAKVQHQKHLTLIILRRILELSPKTIRRKMCPHRTRNHTLQAIFSCEWPRHPAWTRSVENCDPAEPATNQSSFIRTSTQTWNFSFSINFKDFYFISKLWH